MSGDFDPKSQVSTQTPPASVSGPDQSRPGEPPTSQKPPKDVIAKVRLIRRLGGGGAGEVWLGEHQTLSVPVALKVLRPEVAARDPMMAMRFSREAQIAARIDHPFVVRVLDVGEDDDIRYIVMQYVDGGSVSDLLEHGPLPFDQALRMMWQSAQALCAAASIGVVHRDIKPANLMLTKNGMIKLADLGLAKNTGDGGAMGMTQTGHAMGTPYYMSPEQIQDASKVDARSDIYSLGATFFHMLTGRVPFQGSSIFEVMKKQVNDRAPDLTRLRADLPGTVKFRMKTVISKMLEKSPEDRFQSPQELVKALEAIAAEFKIDLNNSIVMPTSNSVPSITAPPTVANVRAERDTRSGWVKWAAVIGGGVIALALAFAFLPRGEDRPVPPPVVPTPQPTIDPAAEQNTKVMVDALAQLFQQDTLTAEQFQLGRNLLRTEPTTLSGVERQQRKVFLSVARGLMPPEALSEELPAAQRRGQLLEEELRKAEQVLDTLSADLNERRAEIEK